MMFFNVITMKSEDKAPHFDINKAIFPLVASGNVMCLSRFSVIGVIVGVLYLLFFHFFYSLFGLRILCLHRRFRLALSIMM